MIKKKRIYWFLFFWSFGGLDLGGDRTPTTNITPTFYHMCYPSWIKNILVDKTNLCKLCCFFFFWSIVSCVVFPPSLHNTRAQKMPLGPLTKNEISIATLERGYMVTWQLPYIIWLSARLKQPLSHFNSF